MKHLCLAVILLTAVACGSRQQQTGPDNAFLQGGRISTSGQKFVDEKGRQVILHGINYVNKDSAARYLFPDSGNAFSDSKARGFNCIRLGIIWDGIEPQPGRYDEAYLRNIERLVQKAADNGLYVVLDMHQDLFSVLFSDGAPRWATLTDGLPHEKGPIWSDSYFISPAVMKAFDNFWANKPAPDGIGIQDHYANMWKEVSRRFAGNKTVIGYDIMNEPFNGSQGQQLLQQMLLKYAELRSKESGSPMDAAAAFAVWGDETKRMEALDWMRATERYKTIIHAATEANQAFEKGPLRSMYQKVVNSIREVDTTAILFLEHPYFSNSGVPSALERPLLADGRPDPQIAYAPHGYDLLVDSKFYSDAGNDRVAYIFSNFSTVSERLGMPVWVGEWGAFYGSGEGMAPVGRFIRRVLDNHLFGNAYWSYYEGIGQQPYYDSVMNRVYTPFTAGDLVSVSCDSAGKSYTCSWTEKADGRGTTVIYIPDMQLLADTAVQLTPAGSRYDLHRSSAGKAGYLVIPATGKAIARSVTISW